MKQCSKAPLIESLGLSQTLKSYLVTVGISLPSGDNLLLQFLNISCLLSENLNSIMTSVGLFQMNRVVLNSNNSKGGF